MISEVLTEKIGKWRKQFVLTNIMDFQFLTEAG